MTNNQQLAAHCLDVIANPQDHLDWVVDMARVALAALTQPASQAFKFPEEAPNALVALCKHMYESKSTGASVAHDVWQDCMEELRLDAPHTAQIEPICATGGAEWVKCSNELPKKDGQYWGWWSEEKRQGPVWFIERQNQFQSYQITHWMPLPAAPDA